MKKSGKILILLTVLTISAALLTACGLFSRKITDIQIEDDEITLCIGEKKAIDYTAYPLRHNDVISFESSDTAVARTTDDGKVEGVSEGTATVTVRAGSGASASVSVKVTYAPLTEITVRASGDTVQQAGQPGREISFTAEVNLGADGNLPFEWKVLKEATGETVYSATGRSILFTPEEDGVNYVVTAAYGQGSDRITSEPVECGKYYALTGIELPETAQTAFLGEEYSVTARFLPEGANPNSSVIWEMILPDDDAWTEVEGQTADKFVYIPLAIGEYRLRARTPEGGVVSNTVSFTADYAPVKDVTVTPETMTGEIGTEADKGIRVSLSWNEEYTAPGLTIKWYINGLHQASVDGNKNIRVTASAQGEVDVFCEVDGVRSNELTLQFIEHFDALTSLRLEADTADGSVVNADGTANFTLIAPEGQYNPQAQVKWYVNGTYTYAGSLSDGFAYAYTVNPTETSETLIYAEVGGVKSNVFTLVRQGAAAPVDSAYLTEIHKYGGKSQNRYVTSQEELNSLIGYARENTVKSLEIYVNYEPTRLFATTENSKLKTALKCYAESGTSPTVSATSATNTTGKFRLTFDYTDASPREPDLVQTGGVPQSDGIGPQYGAGRASYTDFAIESAPSWGESVGTTNMLYKVVGWGYKPEFSVSDGDVKAIYNKAKNVLNSILEEGMTDLEKVRAIYDYLCYDIEYDHKLASMSSTLNNSMRYDGYYIEGIYNNKKAVCDGKSKAFVLMCGIEGIRSVRVTGTANGGGHAWNKVFLDADGDGTAEWYLTDTTWGDLAVVSGSSRYEVLNHAYFLISDADVKTTHIEDTNFDYPEAKGSGYNFYKQTAPYSSTSDAYVQSATEVNYLVSVARSKGYTMIEVESTVTILPAAGLSVMEVCETGRKIYVLIIE